MPMLNRSPKSPTPSDSDLISPLAVTLLFTETDGIIGNIGRPVLYARVAALIGYPRGDSATISLLAAHFEHSQQRLIPDPSASWREQTGRITEAQLRSLLRELCEIGYPERTPRVRGVVDTSMRYATISLLAQVNEQPPWTFSVSMQNSGIDGADADRLRALCRGLFSLARYEAYDAVIYDDAGLERAEQSARLAAEAAVEAVRRSNLDARTLISTIEAEGLTCPHCKQHTSDMRFMDRSPDAESYFICGVCERSFVPADSKRAD